MRILVLAIVIGLVILFVLGLLFFFIGPVIATAIALMILFVVGLLLAFFGPVIMNETFRRVPQYHFATVERFGRQLPGVRAPGLLIKFPWVDKMRLHSVKPYVLPVSVKFLTKDDAWVIVGGLVKFRADPRIIHSGGANDGAVVFAGIGEEVRNSDIEAYLEEKLGGIGGKVKVDQFKENRQALSSIINSFLRCSVPIHLDHNPETCIACRPYKVKSPACPKAYQLIPFYNRHWSEAKHVLDHESENPHDVSVIERRQGIEVEAFDLRFVDLTQETKDAFEASRRAQEKQEAFVRKLEMVRDAGALASDLQESGIDPQLAFNAADVTLSPDVAKSKRIFSLEGLKKFFEVNLGDRS